MVLGIKPLTELRGEASRNIQHKVKNSSHTYIFVVVVDCNLTLHNESFED